MILSNGSHVLIVHRRLFENDNTRFFIGIVLGYEVGIVKVQGHTFIKDAFSGEFIEKRDKRTKIFSIASGTLFVYELPTDLQIDSLTLSADRNGGMRLTDGINFSMDLTEVPHKVPE